jgi:hypothetical protein
MLVEEVALAGAVQLDLIGEMAIDGQPLDASALGDGADGGGGRADLLMQRGGGGGDAAARLILPLGAPLELVAALLAHLIHQFSVNIPVSRY